MQACIDASIEWLVNYKEKLNNQNQWKKSMLL